MEIKAAFAKKGIPFYIDSPTNQQFVILEQAQRDRLAEQFVFEYMDKVDENHVCVRFCTSWSTTREEIEALVKAIETL